MSTDYSNPLRHRSLTLKATEPVQVPAPADKRPLRRQRRGPGAKRGGLDSTRQSSPGNTPLARLGRPWETGHAAESRQGIEQRGRREARLERLVRILETQLKVERERRERDRLDALGVMAAGLAHEFNNLLMRIRGHAELGKLALDRDLSNLDSLREIDLASSEAAELCSRMLAFAGESPMCREPVDLGVVLDQVWLDLEPSMPDGVTLELEVEADLDLLGDPLQVEQAVRDLVTNAAEATSGVGSRVTLRAGRVHWADLQLAKIRFASRPRAGEFVYVEVEDDGPGMDATTQDRLFDPFYSTRFVGRGLGLAVVYGIANQHGGGVEVDSTPGLGTRIRALLAAEPGAPSVQLSLF